MGDNELVLLMVSMTKGGKTTIAQTLCHEGAKGAMMEISSDRTRLTVDWAFYKPQNTSDYSIRVEEILLNENSIRDIFPDKYPDCKEAPKDQTEFLKLFGYNAKERVMWSDVDGIKKHYIENTLNGTGQKYFLHNFLSNEHAQKYIRRIKIKLPMREDMCDRMVKLGRTLTLRDTRGLLDIALDNSAKIEGTCPADLGVDGVDAVLLLCTTMPFANLVQRYAGIYAPVFNAVPVFIMARHDAIATLYTEKYAEGDSTPISETRIKTLIEELMKPQVKDSEWSVQKDIQSALTAGKELISLYMQHPKYLQEVESVANEIEDAYYIYPYAASICNKIKNNGKCPESFDTRLYTAFILYNISDIMKNLQQYIQTTNQISKSELLYAILIKDAFGYFATDHKYVHHGTDVRRIQDAIDDNDILGVKNGITGTDKGGHNRPALITAKLVYTGVRERILNINFANEIENPNTSGNLVNHYCRRILIRRLNDAIDPNAMSGQDCIINRYIVKAVYLRYKQFCKNNIGKCDADWLNNVLEYAVLCDCILLIFGESTRHLEICKLLETGIEQLPTVSVN